MALQNRGQDFDSGVGSARGMEGRRRVGRGNCRDGGKLCSVKCNTAPSPEIFTEAPHTREMFNGVYLLRICIYVYVPVCVCVYKCVHVGICVCMWVM